MPRTGVADPPSARGPALPLRPAGRAAAALLRAASVHRRRLAWVAVAVAVVAGCYELAIRTSLTAVSQVRVVGVRGIDARAIDRALTGAARSMSTLAVDEAALRAAAAPYPVVREVHAYASFPHSLRIVVVEQLPAAVARIGSATTAVAGDGAVLGAAYVTRRLPCLDDAVREASGRLAGPHVAPLLAIAGAAPAPLAADVERFSYGSHGVAAAMRGGLVVYFGSGSLARAKWIALARVLVAPSSHGASSIDVAVPDRPAAAFAGASAGPTSGTSALSGEALIDALTAALAGGSGVTGTTTAPSEPTSTTASEPTSPTASETAPSEQSSATAGGSPTTSEQQPQAPSGGSVPAEEQSAAGG